MKLEGRKEIPIEGNQSLEQRVERTRGNKIVDPMLRDGYGQGNLRVYPSLEKLLSSAKI